MKLLKVAQMQEAEAASDAAGHTYAQMMEQAGQAVADVLTARVEVEGKHILILVGPGNNGGDGLVAARHLAQAGAEVYCYLMRRRDPNDDANYRALSEMQVMCTVIDDDKNGQTLRKLVSGVDIVIDALLGTGITLPVRGATAKALEVIKSGLARRDASVSARHEQLAGLPEPAHRSRPLVVAVDGPSGLDFDTGALDESALSADVTVTFAFPKPGHFRFPGAEAVGELVVADIGIDPSLVESAGLEVATPDMVRRMLPERPLSGHKGTFGRVLIAAGSSNYTGAARLAGAAAVRSGAGLVTVALPASIHGAVAAGLSEATYILLPHELGVINAAAADVLMGQMEGCTAMLFGPGLGQERETTAFVKALLQSRSERGAVGFQSTGSEPPQRPSLPPLVVDADGLNILSTLEDWPALLPKGSILTPHPGEMARLVGCSTSEVQSDRMELARQKSVEWGHTVVLKGAFTTIAAPDGRAVVQPFANPGLATGGTGDVLSGVIVALLGQGMDPFAAAVAGAYLHGLSGEIARQALGTAGMAAGDLVELLPEAWLLLE